MKTETIEVVYMMDAIKKTILKKINNISEEELREVIDFIDFLEMKRSKREFIDLEQASVSGLDFWDNAIDDEVWNDV